MGKSFSFEEELRLLRKEVSQLLSQYEAVKRENDKLRQQQQAQEKKALQQAFGAAEARQIDEYVARIEACIRHLKEKDA